jgi:DNA polymerase I-like protein with 3'-5' exonuclease and polymerase domains
MLECWNREDVFEELKGYLDLIMEDVLPNKFKWLKTPMKVDVAIGDNWSKLK